MKFTQLFTILSALFSAFSMAADVLIQQKPNGGIILENEFLKAEIIAVGGKIVSLEDKTNSKNIINSSGSFSGIGKVRAMEGTPCTEFLDQTYNLKILKNTEDDAVVQCSYMAKQKAHPWYGFEVVKHYSLKKGESRIGMKWIINSYDHAGKWTPFMHNFLRVNEKAYAFVQTAQGLLCREVVAKTSKSKDYNCMVRNVSEPWGAILIPESQNGFLFYDASDAMKELFFWLNESTPTLEPIFNTASFGMNSSWSNQSFFMPVYGLKSCHFASPDYAGGFTQENGKGVLKFQAFTTMGNVKMKLFSGEKLLNEYSFEAKAGRTFTFPAALKKGLQKVRITLAFKEMNKKHDVWASFAPEGQVTGDNELKKEVQPNREYAKCHVPKGKMFVTPDMIVPLGYFAVKENLPAKSKKTIKLIVDVPEGITLMNPMAHYTNCHKLFTKHELKINGQNYIRYEIPQIGFRNTVFASTTWTPGKKGMMYYQLKWMNGEDERKSISVESLTVPKAPFPKLLITNIPGFGMQQKHIDTWPDFYETMRHVGSNTISSSGSMVHNPEILKGFYRQAQEKGFYTFANFLPFHIADGGGCGLYTEKIEKFCAVSLRGSHSKWPCPSYRGKAFKDHVKLAALPGKLGATMLALDTEMWHGGDYCFCDRCMNRFKEFFTKNHPKKKYMNPKEFRKYPEKYPEYCRIWDDFKASLGCEMYREIVTEFRKNLKDAGSKGPVLIRTYVALPPDQIYSMFLRLNDLLRENLVNHVEPSPYTRGDALKFAEKVRQARNAIGNSNVLTWMSAGAVYQDDEYPGIEFRYCLLENFANGARGYMLLPWYGVDADDLREHAITMQMVVPVEDIVLDGTIQKEIIPDNPDVKICGLQKGSEQLILVSEYYDTKATPVSFKVSVPEECKAVDMLTGEVIACLKKGHNEIQMTIPKEDRAVLLYLGNRKLNFDGRQIPGRKVAGVQASNERTAKKNDVAAETGTGKLEISKNGLTVANDFYRISFLNKPPYSELEFVRSRKAIQFYLSNTIRYDTKVFPLLNIKSKQVKKSEDGGEIELIFSANHNFPDGKITSKIVFTFRKNSPVIKFCGLVEQEPFFIRQTLGGSFSYWNFGNKTVKAMPRFCIGPDPEKNGFLADHTGSSIEVSNWKKKYKYFAICDDTNAFGVITPSKEDASIYVFKQGHVYIVGSKIRMSQKSFKTTHYLYAGPEADMGKWAEKSFSASR